MWQKCNFNITLYLPVCDRSGLMFKQLMFSVSLPFYWYLHRFLKGSSAPKTKTHVSCSAVYPLKMVRVNFWTFSRIKLNGSSLVVLKAPKTLQTKQTTSLLTSLFSHSLIATPEYRGFSSFASFSLNIFLQCEVSGPGPEKRDHVSTSDHPVSDEEERNGLPPPEHQWWVEAWHTRCKEGKSQGWLKDGQ